MRSPYLTKPLVRALFPFSLFDWDSTTYSHRASTFCPNLWLVVLNSRILSRTTFLNCSMSRSIYFRCLVVDLTSFLTGSYSLNLGLWGSSTLGAFSCHSSISPTFCCRSVRLSSAFCARSDTKESISKRVATRTYKGSPSASLPPGNLIPRALVSRV